MLRTLKVFSIGKELHYFLKTVKGYNFEQSLIEQRIIYNDKRSSFNALLEKDSSVSFHERNIKILATEMFIVSKNLTPPQMHKIFKLKDQPQYNLRYNSLFSRPLVKSVYKGIESLPFLGPKTWGILADTYKDLSDLDSFKSFKEMETCKLPLQNL